MNGDDFIGPLQTPEFVGPRQQAPLESARERREAAPPEEARPGFQHYANASGKSNVRAYQIEPTSITVEFRDGSRYLYTADSVGEINLYHMKQLAAAGLGLNSFINRSVRKLYVSKG